MHKSLFTRVGIILACLSILSACGGGSSEKTNLQTTLCGGDSLSVRLAYPQIVSAIQNDYTSVSPNLTGVGLLCSVNFSLATGTLPMGMALDTRTGSISGNPTQIGTGSFSVTLKIDGYSGVVTSNTALYNITTPTPTVSWIAKTSNTGMGATNDFQLATVNSKLYAVISKFNVAKNNTDLFLFLSSDNGVTWVDLANIPEALRNLTNFSVVADKGSLFVIGGRINTMSATGIPKVNYNNAVWKFSPFSSLGNIGTWEITAPAVFPSDGREFVATAFDGTSTLYAYGGQSSGGVYNDVLVSTNRGVTWSRIGPSATTYGLSGQCLVASGAALYSFGGFGYSPEESLAKTPPSEKNVILKSTDGGTQWSVVNSSIITHPRRGSCAAIQGRLVYAGGASVDLSGIQTDTGKVVQSATGGVSWVADPASNVFGRRSGHGMTVKDGKLLVLGGVNTPNALADMIEGIP